MTLKSISQSSTIRFTQAQVIACEDSDALPMHKIGINSHLENELKGATYVRIADRIYQVALFALTGVDKPAVLMSRIQQVDTNLSDSKTALIRECDSSIGSIDHLNAFEVHLYANPNENAEQKHLSITPHLLNRESLESKIRNLCNGLILHHNQKLPALLEDQESYSSVIQFGQRDSNSSNPLKFGKASEKTKIKFIYNTAEIGVINPIHADAKSIVFHLTIDDQSMSFQPDTESLCLDREELTNHFKNLLGDRSIIVGQKFRFEYQGHKICLYAEKIDKNSKEAIQKERELTPYRITKAAIDFKIKSPNLLLGENTPIFPEKYEVKVLQRLSSASSLEKDGAAWISIEDLSKELNEKIVINNQIAKVSLPDGDYLVKFFISPSLNTQGLPEHQFYKLTGRSAGTITTNKAVALINSAKRIPLEYLELRIKPKSQSEKSPFLFHTPDDHSEDSQEISKEELAYEIEKINYPLYKTASFCVTVKGISIPLEVISMKGESQESSVRWLGTVSRKTHIEIENNPEATGIVLGSKDNPAIDREVVLKQLKSSLGGLDSVFQEISNIITQSRGGMRVEAKKRGMQPVRGLLLYGEPGTGKTSTANLIGKLLNCKPSKIKKISGTDVFSKWVGDTEKHIRELFEPAQKEWELHGEESDLHMVLIDELDGLLPRRDGYLQQHAKGFVNAFLAKMDGFSQMGNLFVIGATNRIDDIDPAALRYGRFGKKIKVGLPDLEGRKEIFQLYTKVIADNKLLEGHIDYEVLARSTEGASGADIRGLVGEAASLSLNRLEKTKLTNQEELAAHPDGKVTMNDFLSVLEKSKKPQRSRFWG